MKFVAIIVTLVCCGLMFFVKREWKAALLVMGAMTLTIVNIPGIPLHKANYLLQASFLLSEWNHLRYHFILFWRMSYLRNLLLLVSGSTLLAALTTQYVETNEFLQSELPFKYFALAYAFWAVRNEKSLKPVLQVSFYCLIVLTFFGVLNYIDKNAMFVNALTEGRTSLVQEDVSLGDVYTDSNRFRVQSMFKSAFDYGYICVAILMLHLHGWHRRFESNRAFFMVLACCSFGIISCGCRTVWVSAIMSIACYSMWVFHLNRNVLLGMMAMILMILSYYTVPAVEEKVNSVTDVFVEDSETGGSSIALRMTQYAYVLMYIEGNEWLGLGKGYWAYSYAEDPYSVAGLFGVESVILSYLLEQGIAGLALWAIFYIGIFRYFWKNRRNRKALTGLGASLLTLYLFFSIGTGELGSVYPTMLLLGFVIKAIESYRRIKLHNWLNKLRRYISKMLFTLSKRRHASY